MFCTVKRQIECSQCGFYYISNCEMKKMFLIFSMTNDIQTCFYLIFLQTKINNIWWQHNEMYSQHCYQTRSLYAQWLSLLPYILFWRIISIHRKYLLSMLFIAEYSCCNHNCSFMNRTESRNYVIYCFIVYFHLYF